MFSHSKENDVLLFARGLLCFQYNKAAYYWQAGECDYIVKIMDCTLRDGGNVVGNGFSAELTKMMVEGLLDSGVRIIEMGNAKGLGASAKGDPAPLGDDEYLDLIHPYLGKAEVGMFLNLKRFEEENVARAAEKGIGFLRLGTDAGDGEKAYAAAETIRKYGVKVRYSMMKAYLLSPAELAQEAAGLEAHGVNEITVMDSAGTMHPTDAAAYVKALKAAVTIPIGFHGHNNLGMSAANALAAAEAGADVLDCGLLGMARSAGNMPTELAVALMHQQGKATDVDLYHLLAFEDTELIPAMEKAGYHTPLKPKNLILGYSGAHSSFMGTFRTVAQEYGIDLYHLIVETSKLDRKSPTEALMRQVAEKIRGAKQ